MILAQSEVWNGAATSPGSVSSQTVITLDPRAQLGSGLLRHKALRALVELHTQRALQGLHAARHGVRGLGLAQARGLRRAQLLPAPAARIKSDESRRKHRRRKRPEH